MSEARPILVIDDYLPKTFSTRELLARLRAVTRRGRGTPAEREELADEDLTAGELCLNEGTHVAVLGDEPLDLTPLEFAILASLLRSKGRVKTREQLIDDV